MNSPPLASIVRRRLRRLRPAWMLLVLPLMSTPTHGAQEGDFQFETNSIGAVITLYLGPGGTVVIPDRLGGSPVTGIGLFAFSGLTNPTSVTIPIGVTFIGNYAFSGCTSLTNVTIPESVVGIGAYAFSDCTGLTQVTIPNGVTFIDDFVFHRCSGLTNVTLSGSVTTLGYGVFQECRSLTSIEVDVLNPNFSSVGGVLFDKTQTVLIAYPPGRVGDYTVPDGVAYFGETAFHLCTGLTSITIPDSVVSLGTFEGCTGLTNFAFPSSITSLPPSAFYDCTGLINVTIPNSITSIGSFAFSGCTGLTNVTIPNSVTSIEANAFSGCARVTSLTIPDRMTSISIYAFSQCTGLTSITIPTNVTSIGPYAFLQCTALTSVTIANSVTSVMGHAFSFCPNLTSVNFEGNAPAIEYIEFMGSPFVTVFHRAGASGWGITYADQPTAVWVPRPEYAEWAASTGLTARFPATSGEGDDPDGDGASNRAEWFAGTDPTQRASRLELELTPRPADLTASDQTPIQAGQHAVYFHSVSGRYYGLQRASVLDGAWELQAVRIASTPQTRFAVPKPDARAFYRVLALP